ncbi:MAG: response regulator transcription factor [Spirochaetales bacterium]|nr:response regulator transcription factor [Spirochaetales bacterium]
MNSKFITVLLVEDEPAQYALLMAYLEKENYRVLLAEGIKDFNVQIAKEKPHLILLDLNLADGDGLELVHIIKSVHKIPLIIITSRGSISDRVTGLELGADDYICKPYHPKELLLRINKIFDREEHSGILQSSVRKTDRFSFNEELHCFYDRNGTEVKLTAGEYLVMISLVKGQGRVLSRSQLLDNAFHRIEYPYDRTIDVIISRLRKKFRSSSDDSDVIETVKGFGYRINNDVWT